MEKKFRYFIAIPVKEMESKHLGYYLKQTRELLNIKQCKVTEKTIHSDSTISDLERHCKNPYFHTIQNYLNALGVELYALVPAEVLTSDDDVESEEIMMVQITLEELVKIKKSA